MAGATARFRFIDFFVRWLFIFSLSVAIYNPTGYSYVDWLLIPDSEYVPLKIFIGLSLASLLWFIHAMSLRVLSRRGFLVGAVMLTAAAWALDNLGLLPRSTMFLTVLMQAGFAAWHAVGLSLAFVRQQASGLVISSDEH